MALGYCRECDRLVPIVQGAPKNNGTVPPQRDWWPVEHDGPEGPCKGRRRPL